MSNCIKGLLHLLDNLNSFRLLESNIKKNKKTILTTGVLDSQKAHLIASIKEKNNKPILIITSSEVKIKNIVEDMETFLGEKKKILTYLSKDIIFYNADVRSIDIVKQRLRVLNEIINNKDYIIVLSIESLFDKLTPYDKFKNSIININLNTEISMDKFIENITFLGYERKDMVEAPGQFAIRGSIVDIFIPIKDNAIRLEFEDNKINSIRLLDLRNQRSIESLKSVDIFPTKELIYTEKELDNAINLIEKDYKKFLKYYKKENLKEEETLLKKNILLYLEKLKCKKTFNNVDNFIQYFYKEEVSLLDYLQEDTIIFFDEYNKIKQRAKNYYEEFKESINNRILKGYVLSSQINMIMKYDFLLNSFNKFTKIILSSTLYKTDDFKIEDTINFKVKYTNLFKNRIDLLLEDINKYKLKNYKIIILAGGKIRGEKLAAKLLENNISAKYLENIEKNKNIETIIITSGSINKSFEYTDISLVIFSDKELLGDKKKKVKSFKKDMGMKIRSFTDLLIGDYIVHKNHGIGIYQGIETIETDKINKDYLKIAYLDNGILYVPTDQMGMIQKYISINKEKPKINKLGSSLWLKSKENTKKSVKLLAKNLVDLYAKRKETKGFCYTKDTIWQKEFEDMFPYIETDDQLKAIKDVKEDMESEKVMDRLICGDVGYGKTEIAIRAAFKAIQDEKQVAYLVPTTILAQQHYNNFLERMKSFPINIEVLSRFKTLKEQKEIVSKLNKGKIDIIVGTHRILSKDVKFKDLGLVIIDEEQRFGVVHKEKLKEMKKNVDVLTLTATPIPRTLHMSLIGIRDMSILEEPPKKRYPVQTYVMEYNIEYIKDAINREISRNGQVYYLYNRTKDIEEVAFNIQNLIPEAKVSYVHGKMGEDEIEEIMTNFTNRDIDILVCTTIIEIGMDISNVNTIIIQDAENIGLSQLYQLRGRVGRSTRIAYAYLMYKKDKILDEIEEKRLQIIKDFTEFGSGFKIAMRDLEIRGAGNILGADQHGHIDNVGYDMYCSILKDAVKELKGEKVKKEIETSLDINIPAYIPKYYIENEEQKLDIYIKIVNISDTDDYINIKDEIKDRYGKIPKETQNLLDISLLKFIASKLGIVSIKQKGNKLTIKFEKDINIDLSKIIDIVNKNSNVLFISKEDYSIDYKFNNKIENKDIIKLREILNSLQ